MRRTRHVVLPVRSWQYIGLLLVSLACVTFGLVARDREGQAGSLTGPDLLHRAPHDVDVCPNWDHFQKSPACLDSFEKPKLLSENNEERVVRTRSIESSTNVERLRERGLSRSATRMHRNARFINRKSRNMEVETYSRRFTRDRREESSHGRLELRERHTGKREIVRGNDRFRNFRVRSTGERRDDGDRRSNSIERNDSRRRRDTLNRERRSSGRIEDRTERTLLDSIRANGISYDESARAVRLPTERRDIERRNTRSEIINVRSRSWERSREESGRNQLVDRRKIEIVEQRRHRSRSTDRRLDSNELDRERRASMDRSRRGTINRYDRRQTDLESYRLIDRRSRSLDRQPNGNGLDRERRLGLERRISADRRASENFNRSNRLSRSRGEIDYDISKDRRTQRQIFLPIVTRNKNEYTDRRQERLTREIIKDDHRSVSRSRVNRDSYPSERVESLSRSNSIERRQEPLENRRRTGTDNPRRSTVLLLSIDRRETQQRGRELIARAASASVKYTNDLREARRDSNARIKKNFVGSIERRFIDSSSIDIVERLIAEAGSRDQRRNVRSNFTVKRNSERRNGDSRIRYVDSRADFESDLKRNFDRSRDNADRRSSQRKLVVDIRQSDSLREKIRTSQISTRVGNTFVVPSIDRDRSYSARYGKSLERNKRFLDLDRRVRRITENIRDDDYGRKIGLMSNFLKPNPRSITNYQSTFEVIRQAFVIAICIVYGLSMSNGKKLFTGNLIDRINRFALR